MAKLAVVAVGGNSLITDPARNTIADQYEAVRQTASHVVDLIQAGVTVVLSHGNGPQVGFVMRRSELARERVPQIPLDVAVADTQGYIGYHFQQAIGNEFRRRGMQREAVTVVTQVAVAADDPAFANPSKPIGRFMDEATARLREQEEGWNVMEDSGRGWRRVVPSPCPVDILEFEAVDRLSKAGFFVVAVGGGGVPVVRREDGSYEGVAAVIDKDLASSLLAQRLQADVLMIATGVEKVCLNFGKPDQRELARANLAEARQFLSEGHFKGGSMKPKVEAVVAFLEGVGERALITNQENLGRAWRGETGTEFVA